MGLNDNYCLNSNHQKTATYVDRAVDVVKLVDRLLK